MIVVIITLTGLLMVVGYQVLLIIVDLRRALRRLNLILDDSVIGGGLVRPDKIIGLVEMFRKNKSVKTKKHGQPSKDIETD